MPDGLLHMGGNLLRGLGDVGRDLIDFVWPRRCWLCGVQLSPGGALAGFADACEEHGLGNAGLPGWPYAQAPGNAAMAAAGIADGGVGAGGSAGEHTAEGATGSTAAPRARCLRCAAYLAPGMAIGEPCAECRLRPPRFGRTIVATDYADPVSRAWMLAYKHGGRSELAGPLASALATAAASQVRPSDWLVPVPLHRARRLERGFDQARRIADELESRGRGRVLPILRRVRWTEPQGDPLAPARRRNVRSAFRAVAVPPLGARLWIVDDVMTTGTTVSECLSALGRGRRESAWTGVLAVARA